MANGHGGARKGSGRKKRCEEEKVKNLVISAIRKTWGDEEAMWVHICQQAQEGCKHHMAMVTNYLYGKPTERKSVAVDTGEDGDKKTLHLHINS